MPVQLLLNLLLQALLLLIMPTPIPIQTLLPLTTRALRRTSARTR